MKIGIFIRDFNTLNPKVESIFKKLIFISKHLNYDCFLFTYKDIDFKKGFIWGNTLRGDSFHDVKWIYKMFSIPDIVYIQFSSFIYEERERATAALRLLTKINPLIKIFNATNFDKLEVYKMMSKDNNVKKFLPPTELLSPENLIEFINKNKIIYLKPTKLSLTIGVSRITYLNNEYIHEYHVDNQTQKKIFSNPEELKKEIANFVGSQEYIIQKGIDLITKDNSSIVLRSHLFKNANDKWEVTGLAAFVASKYTFTTGRRYGGYKTSGELILNDIFGPKAEKVINKIYRISIEIADFLTKKYPGILAEVGFDLGLDNSKKIWLIEANFKPSWIVFYNLPEHLKKLMVNFFAYCKYLYYG